MKTPLDVNMAGVEITTPNAKVSGAGTASAGLPGYTLPCEET